MRSLLARTLCLSLLHTSYARVADSPHDLRDAQTEPEQGRLAYLKRWANNLFHKRQVSNDGCTEDVYYDFVTNLTASQPSFCMLFMEYPNVTVTVDYTPTSTVILTSTRVVTTTTLERVTPLIIVTTTATSDATMKKREAAAITPAVEARDVQIARAARQFRRQNAAAGSSTSVASSDISASLSSACSCLSLTGITTTVTYTDAAVLSTLNAFVRSVTTVYTTRTAAPVVTTTTVNVQPSTSSTDQSSDTTTSTTSSATQSSSSTQQSMSSATQSSILMDQSTSTASTSVADTSTGLPASMVLSSASVMQGSTTTSSMDAGPTAPPFNCPADNNKNVSQMIGSERFDYLVLCDTFLGDNDFYDALNYASFSECVAACSILNDDFDYPVCKGVSYYATAASSSGGNCHIKRTAEQGLPAAGTDSAILQVIAIGISSTNPGGTSSEVPPLFAGTSPTANADQISSSVSNIMSNLSQVIPITTPATNVVHSGLLANFAPITQFRTYISDGSTYSSGTTYSFYTSFANGSWYSSYYSSYTVAYAAATTIYGETSNGEVIQSSSDSYTEELPAGSNGDTSHITTSMSKIYNSTGIDTIIVTTNQTYDQGGNEIFSTASTSEFFVRTASGADATGIGGGGGGDSGGGPASTTAGPITSTYVSSYVSTYETVISNSVGTAGETYLFTEGMAVPASTTVNAITSTYSTAFSTVIYNTGGTGGSGSGSGNGGESIIAIISGTPMGTSGETMVIESGVATPPSTATGTFTNSNDLRNGEQPSSSESSSISTVIYGTSTGTGASFSTEDSGGPPTVSSGSPPTPSTDTFTNSNLPRSGTDSTTMPTTTSPLSTSSTDTFTNSNLPRSGTDSGSSTTMPYSIPLIPTQSQGYVPPPPPSSMGPPETESMGYPPPPSTSPATNSLTYFTAITPPAQPASTSTPFSNTNLPRSGTDSTPSESLPPTYTGPVYIPPANTITPSPSSQIVVIPPPDTTPAPPPTTSPTPIGYYTNSNGDRVPYFASSTTTPIPPPVQLITSCSSPVLATTTIFTTQTVYGCYAGCPAQGYGNYGYGQAPPVLQAPAATTTSQSTMMKRRRRG